MECGGCTFCCKVLYIASLNKNAGDDCKHCILNVGCKIHGDHPKECKNFMCAYYQADKAHIELRPDKCNVMFERFDKIMLGTMNPEYNEAYKNDIVQKQTLLFLDEGFSIVFVSPTLKTPIIVPGKGKTSIEVIEELKLARQKWLPMEQI